MHILQTRHQTTAKTCPILFSLLNIFETQIKLESCCSRKRTRSGRRKKEQVDEKCT